VYFCFFIKRFCLQYDGAQFNGPFSSISWVWLLLLAGYSIIKSTKKTQLLNLGCSARIVIEKFDNPKKALAPLSHHTHTYLDA
jgi:hypothetical protein